MSGKIAGFDYFQVNSFAIPIGFKRFGMVAQHLKGVELPHRGSKRARNFRLAFPSLLESQHFAPLFVKYKISWLHNVFWSQI